MDRDFPDKRGTYSEGEGGGYNLPGGRTCLRVWGGRLEAASSAHCSKKEDVSGGDTSFMDTKGKYTARRGRGSRGEF